MMLELSKTPFLVDGAMTEQISPELFQHLVQLAALELSPEESEYLRGQLNKQLKAIQELAAIPLEEGVPIATHGVPYSKDTQPPPRGDDWQTLISPEAILDQAPEVEEGYIVVPDIPHTELE